MRFFRWVLLPRDEVLDSLRAQVGRTQRKLNRAHEKNAQMAAKGLRLKAQIAGDQRYIDALEANVMPADLKRIREQMKDARASDRSLVGAQPEEESGGALRQRAPETREGGNG